MSNSQRGNQPEPTKTARVFPAGYGIDIAHTIQSMTLRNPLKVTVAGTQAIRVIRYSADYDAVSTYKIKSYDKTAQDFQRMIERLISTPNYIVGDIKCGEIPEYQIYDGTLSHDGTVTFNSQKSIAALNKLFGDAVISHTEFLKLKSLLHQNAKPLTPTQHNALKKIDYHKIRWTPDDVLAGHRLLPNGKLYTLQDGLRTGLTKVDLLAYAEPVGYNEFSMIYIIQHDKHFNIKMNSSQVLSSIKSEIYEKIADKN